MKKLLLPVFVFGLSIMQISCDTGEEPAFGIGTGTTDASATGIVSRTNFTLLFSEFALDVFDANTGAFQETSTEINIHTGDRKGLPVSNQVVQVRVQWGVLSSNACTTDVDGNCAVTWTTSDQTLAPLDTLCVRVVAYTTGEEAYFETNINDSTLDPTDAASAGGNTFPYSLGFWDMSEPYFDHNHDGSYSLANGDINIDLNGNGVNDAADTLFNGASCTATDNQCTTTATTTTIWNESYIDLLDESKITPASTPPLTNICQQIYF